MPFTPFHMGPGLAVKSLLGRRFSLMVFGFSQVLIDIEPLVRIIRGDAVLHGLTHTYAGATLIAIAAVFVGRPVCRFVLSAMRPRDVPAAVLTDISWSAASAGAFVGAYSHVALDSIMHADMQPLWPMAASNPLLGILPVGSLHVVCLVSGAVGAVLVGGRMLLWAEDR